MNISTKLNFLSNNKLKYQPRLKKCLCLILTDLFIVKCSVMLQIVIKCSVRC